jgi:hypothetical protein
MAQHADLMMVAVVRRDVQLQGDADAGSFPRVIP